jgi:hypothetical protein
MKRKTKKQKPAMQTEPKQILLSKEHDITDFAGEDPARENLNGVYYDAKQKRVAATNGRILISVPVIESDGEFPPVTTKTEKAPESCLIACAPFRKALGNIPKSSSLPILSRAKLDVNGKVTLTTTDLDTEQAVTCNPIDAKFPITGASALEEIPKDAKCVSVGSALLEKLVTYANKHGKPVATTGSAIKLYFGADEEEPIRFSIKTRNGLVATGCFQPLRNIE